MMEPYEDFAGSTELSLKTSPVPSWSKPEKQRSVKSLALSKKKVPLDAATLLLPMQGAAAGWGGGRTIAPRELTKEMLCNATRERQNKHENVDQFLSRLGIVHLQGLRLGPSLHGLQKVPYLTGLFAYDNLVSSLDGFEALRRLQFLYVQNNRLTSLHGLEGLSQLRKLHAGYNRIAQVDSLESCKSLEELLVPGQRPQPGGYPLAFCEKSIEAIAPTLRNLDVADNGIEEVGCLHLLRGLETLNLADNAIMYVDTLRSLLAGDRLTRVILHGNPFTTLERKHRFMVVKFSPAIQEVDGKPLLLHERAFTHRLEERKRKLESQRQRLLQKASLSVVPQH